MRVAGIDPGTETGLAIWETNGGGALVRVSCMTILAAMEVIANERIAGAIDFVIFEDARKRKWFGERADANTSKYGAGVREGVGSVKRDCTIWEEFLERHAIPYEARYPRATKYDAAMFARITGWTGRTNEHARDAAMIVFGLNGPMTQAKLLTWSDGRAGADRPADQRGGARPAAQSARSP